MSLFRKKKVITEYEAKKFNMINTFERLKINGTKAYFDSSAKFLLKDNMLIALKSMNDNTIWSLLIKQGKDYFFRQFEEFSVIDDNGKKIDFVRIYQGKDFMEYRVDSIDMKSNTDESAIVLSAITTYRNEEDLTNGKNAGI